ncbi:plastidic atp/ADP-transporter [Phtheirospermum japonicum]|uniref:ADP,ATP carrier protein n=1 Tax=Phtheirospermum japonicum TaxID=374723 RepID=A0A830CQ61_9LAMI|nr:plastidic atp/ADP-transporter [Phtheirospermum japonicum]
MQGVLQSKGLFSLPSNPKPRAFLAKPSCDLRYRFNPINPLSKSRTLNNSPSLLSPHGFSKFQGFATKPQLITQKTRNYPICRAEAAAAASSDGQFFNGEKKEIPDKFLGIEVLTLKKILPLGMMFFCILFNYTILRDTKDVLVVTAKGSSAEIIPFLKTWVNLPMAIGFMLLYTKLANVLSKDALFYTVMLPFIAFFGAFGFVLYPLSNFFHPTALADKLLNVLGPRFLGPLAILRIWSFCLFYVMAELWGSVVVSVLFWGFANQVTIVLA